MSDSSKLQAVLEDEFARRLEDAPPDAHPADRAGLAFTTGWHHHPLFLEAVWHEGINLGEMIEYPLWQEAVRVLTARASGKPA